MESHFHKSLSVIYEFKTDELSTSFHNLSLRDILILSCHLCWGFWRSLSPSCFWQTVVCISSLLCVPRAPTIPSQPVCLWFILILSSHLCQGYSKRCFSFTFLTSILYAFLICPKCATSRQYPHPTWFNHPNNACQSVQIINLLILQFYPTLCLFLPFMAKFYQHPVLKCTIYISLNVRDWVSHLHKTTGIVIVCVCVCVCIYIYFFLCL